MVLDAPWVLELGVWLLEPLRSLDSILARPDQRNHSVCIVAARIIDCLEKDVIETVDDRSVFRRGAGNLVDGLKSNHFAFASQLGANLFPQLA